jgi:hypothetical protein
MDTDRKISDERAMNAIAALMSGSEWSADTLDVIADMVRATGRTVADSGEYEDVYRSPFTGEMHDSEGRMIL